MTKEPLTRVEYYGRDIVNHPLVTPYREPFVHPSECDHEIDPEVPLALCLQCCPCDLCGESRVAD